MSVLDHVSLQVADIARSKAFYAKALAPLGAEVVMEFGTACGIGRRGKPDLWLSQGTASFQRPEQIATITPVHVAFAARSRAEVDAFYEAAIEAGGKDFGPPGLRPEYHASYYGAFVIDFDGHNVEAVFHGAE